MPSLLCGIVLSRMKLQFCYLSYYFEVMYLSGFPIGMWVFLVGVETVCSLSQYQQRFQINVCWLLTVGLRNPLSVGTQSIAQGSSVSIIQKLVAIKTISPYPIPIDSASAFLKNPQENYMHSKVLEVLHFKQLAEGKYWGPEREMDMSTFIQPIVRKAVCRI